MTLQTNAAAVRSLLDRFTISTPDSLTHALDTLTAQVKLSMQNTQAYTIPLDQQLPAEHPIEVAAAFVHPYNVAAALVSLAVAAPQVGRDVVAPDPTAMVYVPELGGWKAVGAVQLVPVPVQISLAPPPAPAAAVPPPPPAAPAAVPLPPAPKGDIVDLVNASLGDLAA
ncbi:hypothetical protein LPJ08_29115, partial [Klebsiella pneumoniae]|nr:hypothetical protein [Klebsiella pneumoniae]